MAPRLREHLANKGRPNEAEQMVRENSPVAPWEQQERGEWGHSQGGFISWAGLCSGVLENTPLGRAAGWQPRTEQRSKELRVRGLSTALSCWDAAGWEVEAEEGLSGFQGWAVPPDSVEAELYQL